MNPPQGPTPHRSATAPAPIAPPSGQPAALAGRWFDGLSSRSREVLVTIEPTRDGPQLVVACVDGSDPAPRVFVNRQIDWPERWSRGHAPSKVMVDLREHGSLEIISPADWQSALAQAGYRPTLHQRMLTHWPVLLGVLLVAVASLWAFYRWGTPWAATQITRQVPLRWETDLTQKALKDLDQNWLKPSQLPPVRQAHLRERFAQLTAHVSAPMRRYSGYAPPLTLLFRSGMGANAFALPGGTVVMTDALVLAASRDSQGDEALMGVLAHEVGHVMQRHTTRMVVEQGVLHIGMGLAMGDASVLLSLGSSVLTGLAYRRNHETEADCFAVALMAHAGLPTGPMADLLLGIEGRPNAPASQEAMKPSQAAVWTNLLSSHPDTVLRAQRLKQGHAEGC